MAKVKVELELSQELVEWARRLANKRWLGDGRSLTLNEWFEQVLRSAWLGYPEEAWWFEEEALPRIGGQITVPIVERYCRENGLTHVNAEGFIDYYDMIGWVNGKGKLLEDWGAALVEWNYILSAMCDEDWNRLFDEDRLDPRVCMWKRKEEQDGEMGNQECAGRG